MLSNTSYDLIVMVERTTVATGGLKTALKRRKMVV
jgi:hypothetical protein